MIKPFETELCNTQLCDFCGEFGYDCQSCEGFTQYVLSYLRHLIFQRCSWCPSQSRCFNSFSGYCPDTLVPVTSRCVVSYQILLTAPNDGANLIFESTIPITWAGGKDVDQGISFALRGVDGVWFYGAGLPTEVTANSPQAFTWTPKGIARGIYDIKIMSSDGSSDVASRITVSGENTPTWRFTDWTACTRECGGGIASRKVTCESGAGVIPDSSCAGFRPAGTTKCNAQKCPSVDIFLTSPHSNDVLVAGANYTIRWQGGEPYGHVGIYLVPPTEIVHTRETQIEVVIAVVPNTGSYFWQIPTILVPRNNYILKVHSLNVDGEVDPRQSPTPREKDGNEANQLIIAILREANMTYRIRFGPGGSGDVHLTLAGQFGEASVNITKAQDANNAAVITPDVGPIRTVQVNGDHDVTSVTIVREGQVAMFGVNANDANPNCLDSTTVRNYLHLHQFL